MIHLALASRWVEWFIGKYWVIVTTLHFDPYHDPGNSVCQCREIILNINWEENFMMGGLIAESSSPATCSIPSQRFLQTRYFAALTGSAGFVSWRSCSTTSHFFDYLPHFFHLGFLGVDVFFVFSGLLIESLILREKLNQGTFSLVNFYVRRGLRIFPIYYLHLLVILTVLLILILNPVPTRFMTSFMICLIT